MTAYNYCTPAPKGLVDAGLKTLNFVDHFNNNIIRQILLKKI